GLAGGPRAAPGVRPAPRRVPPAGPVAGPDVDDAAPRVAHRLRPVVLPRRGAPAARGRAARRGARRGRPGRGAVHRPRRTPALRRGAGHRRRVEGRTGTAPTAVAGPAPRRRPTPPAGGRPPGGGLRRPTCPCRRGLRPPPRRGPARRHAAAASPGRALPGPRRGAGPRRPARARDPRHDRDRALPSPARAPDRDPHGTAALTVRPDLPRRRAPGP